MENSYDIIIIGAGPNGYTAGAYLAKAGLKVLILERRLEAGGGLATDEVTLGAFLHNTHSVYHMMVDYAPVYKDLNMQRHEVKYVHPDLQFALPLSDGKWVGIYRDPERTAKSFAKFSRKDADAYLGFHRKLKAYMDDFLGPATYMKPVPTLEQVVNLQQTEMGREILEFSEKSPQAIINENFENEHIRTLLLYAACHWGLDHDMEGIGYLALIYLDRATNYRLSVGGSHMVGQAFNKALIENGGMILRNQRITKIVVDGGKATGVQLSDGKIIEARKAILSTIDPYQTFFQLVGKDNLDPDFVAKLDNWQWEKWSLFEVNLALAEPPRFKAAASDPDLDKALVYVLGFETVADLLAEWEAIAKGEVNRKPGFNCCFPSVHDPKQAPPGKCTGKISRMAAYDLKEGKDKWLRYEFRQEQAEACIEVLRRYAPNLTPDKVLWSYVSTPVDIEAKFPDMVKGSIKQGAYLPLQMGYQRPNDDCSMNRTPIGNLYLGGSSCNPGGLVTFGAGYVAANTVAEDLGIKKWWSEPECVVAAKAKGTI